MSFRPWGEVTDKETKERRENQRKTQTNILFGNEHVDLDLIEIECGEQSQHSKGNNDGDESDLVAEIPCSLLAHFLMSFLSIFQMDLDCHEVASLKQDGQRL
jgi:hypothetical protein